MRNRLVTFVTVVPSFVFGQSPLVISTPGNGKSYGHRNKGPEGRPFEELNTEDIGEIEIEVNGGVKKFHRSGQGKPDGFIGENDDLETIHLLKKGNIVVGSIVSPRDGTVYQIRPNSKGKSQVFAIDQTSFRPEESESSSTRRGLKGAHETDQLGFRSIDSQETDEQGTRYLARGSATSEIGVIVLWTRAAECKFSGLNIGCDCSDQTKSNMESLVALSISETNYAFSSSGVNARVSLVHSYREESYQETSSAAAVTSLGNPTDGHMDNIESLRVQYGGDAVVVLVHDSQYCGYGRYSYPAPQASRMFSAVAWDCSAGYYSFGHELGHNFVRIRDGQCQATESRHGYSDAF